MKNRTIYRAIVLAPAVALIVAACSSSLQIPGQTGEESEEGGAGIPFPVGQGGDAGLPSPETAGSTGASGSGDIEDLEDIFDDSLGDFDKEIGQEQVGMSTGGMGSTQSARRRESSDARTTERQSRKRIGVASADKSDRDSRGMDGENSGEFPGAEIPGGDRPAQEGGTGGENTGSEVFEGETEAARDGGPKQPAHKIPENVAIDASNEDKVAEQIREAAMAEDDPLIREALWEEYRRMTGQTAD